ncbi:hypothetical protein [Streptomyces chartreusis]|uniref:hypothetical protein n=1 Tax=Streptomyces chartreusis TaxID=1969 RepID=UPI00123D9C55|nr:hypothetical protein [Streptomyces chartreusis]QEV66276.1 hypothetical protein CP983_06070 [Streptomyces chartreusis]GGW99181.1 hypothetical protein GCM10010321_12090 [Streptomyces chartreusis]
MTTAPLPSPRLSPMAGLFNALVRHVNRLLRKRIGELNTQIADARNRNQQLTTARDFADSDGAGYIDRSFLEA